MCYYHQMPWMLQAFSRQHQFEATRGKVGLCKVEKSHQRASDIGQPWPMQAVYGVAHSLLACAALPANAEMGVTTLAIAIGTFVSRVDDYHVLLNVRQTTCLKEMTAEDGITYLQFAHDLVLTSVITQLVNAIY